MSKTISKSVMKSMLLILILAATSTMATAAMTVSTSDSSGDSGTIVQIPVTLSDAPTLGSLGFTLTYDSSVLTNTGYTTGDIFAAGSMKVVNNGTPGTIIASVISMDGINTADSGSILVFTFTVTGTTGETSDLALSSVSASDTSAASVATETSSGTFTVTGVPTGMGVITSDSSGDSGTIVQIPVTLSDAPTLGSLGFTLTYDSSVLTNTGYTTGDIFAAGSMKVVNNGTPGTIIASVISMDGINTADSGSILVFTFTVDGSTGETSDLALSSASASDTSAVPVTTYTSSGTFTVTAAGAATLASITISPTPCTLDIGDSQTLTAVCKDTGGSVMTCPTLTWNSTNTTVGTITSAGVFTALAEGTTTITASAEGMTSNDATVTVCPTGAVIVHLYTGWNLIAVPVNDPDANTAAELASKITGCKEVVKWDAATQTYDPYANIEGDWTGTDFAITGGTGLFVNVEGDTTVGFTGGAWS